MRTLTITYGENSRGGYEFDVTDEYGRHTQAVTFGEMLEQVTELTHPLIARRMRYPMRTDDEWAELDRQRQERMAARRAAAAAGHADHMADGPLPF